MSTLAEWTPYYNKRGLATFPIYLDKNPCTPNGFYDAEVDPEKAVELFKKYPQAAGIGIATGKVSGNIFVVDLDHHPDRGVDGIEIAEEWQHDHGPFPETWTAVSGSGGRHLYFWGTGEEECQKNEEAGVDVRGNGGYIVAPPSKHPSGGVYYWDLAPDEIDLARATGTVYQFIATYKKKKLKGQRLTVPKEIAEGSRNHTLFRVACSLQSMGLPDEVIEVTISKLNEASCKPPVSDREINAILGSVAKYEKGEKINSWQEAGRILEHQILEKLLRQMQANSSKS